MFWIDRNNEVHIYETKRIVVLMVAEILDERKAVRFINVPQRAVVIQNLINARTGFFVPLAAKVQEMSRDGLLNGINRSGITLRELFALGSPSQ